MKIFVNLKLNYFLDFERRRSTFIFQRLGTQFQYQRTWIGRNEQ
jgi:hypothetical protein